MKKSLLLIQLFNTFKHQYVMTNNHMNDHWQCMFNNMVARVEPQVKQPFFGY